MLKQPLYQYLWAEMLNYGICVKANPPRGISLLRDAAEQGSAEAMVRIAEYYHDGQFVIQDKQRAVQYTLPAAANGDLPARMMLVRLFGEGYGSPEITKWVITGYIMMCLVMRLPSRKPWIY